MGIYSSYLVKIPDGYLLLDTGYDRDYKKFKSYLKKNEIELKQIKYVFVSHHHDDHVGFIGNLVNENSKVKLILHEKTVPLLLGGKNNKNNGGGIVNKPLYVLFKIKMSLSPKWTLTFPPFDIRDQDIIIRGERDFLPNEVGIDGKIIHTKGHTSDGMCLILMDNYIFVGDEASNFLNWAGAGNLTIFNENLDEVYKSWENIISRGIPYVIPTHGKAFKLEMLKKNIHKRKQTDLVKFF
jgi:glyoxylase-like metal-dependent hydrolase (beta-lactamase superfamily II)